MLPYRTWAVRSILFASILILGGCSELPLSTRAQASMGELCVFVLLADEPMAAPGAVVLVPVEEGVSLLFERRPGPAWLEGADGTRSPEGLYAAEAGEGAAATFRRRLSKLTAPFLDLVRAPELCTIVVAAAEEAPSVIPWSPFGRGRGLDRGFPGESVGFIEAGPLL